MIEWYEKQHIAVKILLFIPALLIGIAIVAAQLTSRRSAPTPVVDYVADETVTEHEAAEAKSKQRLTEALKEIDKRREIDKQIEKLKETKDDRSNDDTIDERVDRWNTYWPGRP